MLRKWAVRIHRIVGLVIAGFLFVSGITGAVISWDHEVDEWLNPHLTEARASGPALPALDLAGLIESRDRQVRVTFVPLALEPGHSYAFGVEGRVDADTGRQSEIGYNQVFLDPASGEELGRREWGQVWPITRETLISFLYKLHYSLHVPEMWGIAEWGLWLLGGVAILWTIDCFVGFYLTLPVRKPPRPGRAAAVERQLAKGWWTRWKPAWTVRIRGSAYRIVFDIHRAFSLWTWAILFVLAFTAFSLNLYREVFYPLMSMVSEVTPSPFETRTPLDRHQPIEPRIDRIEALERAKAAARLRGWPAPAGSLFYAPAYGVYVIAFFQPGDDHGAAGVGPPLLYVDGVDGRLLGERLPWKGTAADIFVQAQFPLHSGRILGLPGRILISAVGLVVASLSVTGVAIWWRKRAARRAVRRKDSLIDTSAFMLRSTNGARPMRVEEVVDNTGGEPT
jgi:uncharacterized iron-regulated membrane protein